MSTGIFGDVMNRHKKIYVQETDACSRIKEAIKDEEAAPTMYEELLESLKELNPSSDIISSGHFSIAISKIIKDEKRHKKELEEIAHNISCSIIKRR